MTTQHPETAVRSEGTQEAVKHTPGPWEAVGEPTGDFAIFANQVPIAWACPHIDDNLTWKIPAAANARLIAASPDLLAACQDCMENRGDWAAKMYAAIAKAGAS